MNMLKIIRKISTALFAGTAAALFIYGAAAQMLDRMTEGFLLLTIAGMIWFSCEDEEDEKDGGHR